MPVYTNTFSKAVYVYIKIGFKKLSIRIIAYIQLQCIAVQTRYSFERSFYSNIESHTVIYILHTMAADNHRYHIWTEVYISANVYSENIDAWEN